MLEYDVRQNATVQRAADYRNSADSATQERPAGSHPIRATPGLGRVGGTIAWRRDDLSTGDWRIPVSADALAELDLIADALADYDGPVEDLSPDAFDWPATTELAADIRVRVKEGIGFAILDRLPMERWTGNAIRSISWMINDLVATPMMQKAKGARLYDVRDTGATLQHGIRRSVTNLEQEFHTDGSWLALTPDIMGLVCVNQAPQGGMSRAASLVTAHDELLETAPDLLERLYENFYWDRQAEHGGNEDLTTWRPVFERHGERLMVRYYDDYIRNGYRLMKMPMDLMGNDALNAMRRIVERPENCIEFRLEPGQIEFLDNQTVSHGRTAFEDAPKTPAPRHMLRFWLRSGGEIELDAERATAQETAAEPADVS